MRGVSRVFYTGAPDLLFVTSFVPLLNHTSSRRKNNRSKHHVVHFFNFFGSALTNSINTVRWIWWLMKIFDDDNNDFEDTSYLNNIPHCSSDLKKAIRYSFFKLEILWLYTTIRTVLINTALHLKYKNIIYKRWSYLQQPWQCAWLPPPHLCKFYRRRRRRRRRPWIRVACWCWPRDNIHNDIEIYDNNILCVCVVLD